MHVTTMKRIGWFILVLLLSTPALYAQQLLYQSDAFTITEASVRQGDFLAVVDAPTRIRSSYLYYTALRPRRIQFKFALNGQDNEAPLGQNHELYLVPEEGQLVTPVYSFGNVTALGEEPRLEKPVQGRFAVTFRVDLRALQRAFEAEGIYMPPQGEPIQAEDFNGVYIAGSEQPLTWDFNALTEQHRLADLDGDGIYEVTLHLESGGARPFDDAGFAVWTLGEAIDAYPPYASGQPLVDALYNLSLEELRQNIREDGAFRAGAKWPGVWTRDISYSIVLSLAFLEPEVSKKSLLAKTRDGIIIQDTGTGGSWPVSSDRMVWALAAWEVYLTTGDEGWLRDAYAFIKQSAEADLRTVLDPETGLFFGESSFLDWREQTYPRWMDPKDIYLSQCLGTNAVFYATYHILGQMADLLGEPSDAYFAVAEGVKNGINAYLWQPDEGYYGQYRYGRNVRSLSPRAEALGAALAVQLDIANAGQKARLLRRQPLTDYGVPSIYPQIPGIPPYHNDGIWPFVVAYWTWAGATGGNSAAVEHGLASIYRAAALFLTNKENMVATTGHFEGTQINSDSQLWSLAGTLATVYRVFFGMQFHPDRLVFRPFVPEAYGGTRTLSNLRYRGATLTVTVEGYGHEVASVMLDGQPVDEAVISGNLEGEHTLVITLKNAMPGSRVNVVENRFTPETPRAVLLGNRLTWEATEGAVVYEVYRNGQVFATSSATDVAVQDESGLAEYQVRAVDGRGLRSFLSEPVRVVPTRAVTVVQPPSEGQEQTHAGYTGDGYLPLTKTGHRTVRFTVDIPETRTYSIDVRYANGSGPINTDNKAAIRTLSVDGMRLGALVMAQRGEGRWDDWGYSNPLLARLPGGTHTVELSFTASDENMNGDVNTALLDHLRLTHLRQDVP